MLRTQRALLLSFALISVALFGTSARAQSLPAFNQVDFIYAQNPQLFQTLWQNATTQTVRIAVLGDSQETSPTSHGYDYIPRLNYEMWQRFGNAPETPIEGCFYYGNGTTPPADWLMAGGCTESTATRIDPTYILPNILPKAFSTVNPGNVSGKTHGQLSLLQQDAAAVDAGAAIPTTTSYFNTAGTVKAQIFAATNASSGEVAYQARPNTSSIPSYSAAVTTTGTLTLGLTSGTFDVKSGLTSALNFNGKKYMSLEVFGSDDNKLTDIVGLRFLNQTYPQGVVVDTFSLGGYTASMFLSDHANAGAMFAEFGFQAAVIHYGANEGGSVSATQFQSDITAVVAKVRSWTGNANFPVILIADVYQTGLSQMATTQYDQYVGAELAIAQADSHVMVINARRLMEDIGWNATSGQASTYLADGIHYTPTGAKVLAAAEVAAMMGEVDLGTGCMTDPGSLALPAALSVNITIGGTTACSNLGKLSVAQTLTVNQATLKVSFAGGFTPASGQQFQILSFASASGTFATLSLPTLPSGLSWNTSALYTTGKLSIGTPPPTAPTLAVTSGGAQTITLPAALGPVGFTLSGSGALTVTAQSSNTTLLPNSGVAISAGCGTSSLTCTATLTPVATKTGTATITLSVSDTYAQSASGTASIQINPASTPPPAPPTLTVTSGSAQTITLPATPATIGFTLTGTGALVVTAQSSNATLLPSSAIAIDSGCGTSTLACTATLTPVASQTGAATITLAVSDAQAQSASGTATIQINAAVGSGGGGSTGGGSSSGGGGGGGSLDLLSLAALAGLVAARRRWVPVRKACRTGGCPARLPPLAARATI